MGFTKASGRNAKYDYFFCFGRANHKNGCKQKYVKAAIVERAVENEYSKIKINKRSLKKLAELIHEGFELLQRSSDESTDRQRRRIAKADRQLRKLLELHYEDSIDPELFREEQQRVRADKAQAQAQMQASSTRADDLMAHVDRALGLMSNSDEMYQVADDPMRRRLNAELFETFVITDENLKSVKTEVFEAMTAPDLIPVLTDDLAALRAEQDDASDDQDGSGGGTSATFTKPKSKNRTAKKSQCGSRMRKLVGLKGLEPWCPARHRVTAGTHAGAEMTATASTRRRVLTEQQIAHYHERGYVLIENAVSPEWIKRLTAASDEFVDESRTHTESTKKLDLEAGHTAENPRLRRLTNPVDNHAAFAEFAFTGPAADIALDLLGASAKFHHSKLNYKWAGGGEAVEWHQDIQYWPHTDFTPLTIGVYLNNVDQEMGPMGIVPGSHTGELYNLYDEQDEKWTGSIRTSDLARVDTDSADYLMGPAGSITVHNCGCVHGSAPNRSDRVRPLLLQTYSAVDSYPLLGVGTNGAIGRTSGQLVGAGAPPRTLTVNGRTMPAAPDWSRGGYTTIFDVQHDDS